MATATVDVDTLRAEIQKKYAEVATEPSKEFHFRTGRPIAEMLGYPTALLDELPARVVESFAGVGNPFSLGAIGPGESIVDIGSGSGFDCIVAAQHVQSTGRVIGVDMTQEMLAKANASRASMGLENVEFRFGYAESLPVEDGWADVVISNGVINLCPDKEGVFREVHRILKPGGRLMLADIVTYKPVPEEARENIDLWTAWIGGALLEAEYLDLIRGSGLEGVELVWSAEVFKGAGGEASATAFDTMGVNIRARKPA